MKRTALSLILVFLFSTICSVIHAEESMDVQAIMAAAMAAAQPAPVVPNNKPIVIGQMDPNAIYEPGLVVYDPASKHIVLVNSSGKPNEFKGVIQNGEVIQYANVGYTNMRCPINAKRKLHGTARFYKKDGSIWQTSEYKDGLYDGVTTGFYPNGKPRTDCTYSKDILNGPSHTYSETGEIIAEIVYINGLPQPTKQNEATLDILGAMMEKEFSDADNNIPQLQKELQAERDAWDGFKILKVDR